MVALTLTAVLGITILCSLILWRNRLLNPTILFVAFSGFFVVGTILNLDFHRTDDTKHLTVILLYFSAILTHVLFFHDHERDTRLTQYWKGLPNEKITKEMARRLFFLLLLTSVVNIIYYQYLVGYNLTSSALARAAIDLTSARLSAYAGETYTGAGIVNQFKNTIFPIVAIAMFYFIRNRFGRVATFVYILLIVPFALWSLLGTGQRTFLFFAFAGLMLSLLYSNRLTAIKMAYFVPPFFVLFTIMSASLGRTEDVGLSIGFQELIFRFFFSNQIGTVFGFRLVDSLPIQFGWEWFEILRGYIPGVPGSNLANRVHDYMFGSMRGTGPVALWVSTYHNFGLVAVFPITLVFIKGVEMARLLLLYVPKNDFWIVFLAFFFFYLGITPATDAFQIINNGLLGLIFIILIMKIRVRGGRFVFIVHG
jgi:hypothetical protein